MPWGQVVVGPPGSGKTTFCKGMQQFLVSIDRDVVVVNLDPANDVTPYPCTVDIRDLVTVEDVMDAYGLGPNGALMYCMEFLLANFDWLQERLSGFKSHYVLFDFPGQAELYTHHSAVASILAQLSKKMQYRLCAVHLVDAHHACDAGKFIPAALLSLATMMRLELPHVNVLSKVDMLTAKRMATPLDLDAYTSELDLPAIVGTLPGRDVWNASDSDEDGAGSGAGHSPPPPPPPPIPPSPSAAAAARLAATRAATKRRAARFYAKFNKLNETIAGVVEDYSLLAMHPVSVEDKGAMLKVVEAVDRANGFVRAYVKRGKISDITH